MFTTWSARCDLVCELTRRSWRFANIPPWLSRDCRREIISRFIRITSQCMYHRLTMASLTSCDVKQYSTDTTRPCEELSSMFNGRTKFTSHVGAPYRSWTIGNNPVCIPSSGISDIVAFVILKLSLVNYNLLVDIPYVKVSSPVDVNRST